MPRRNRREPSGAPDADDGGEFFSAGLEERILGPAGARMDGFDVRTTLNKLKRYRCPYCEGWVEPGIRHMVAVPVRSPEARRHYHSGCWDKHVKGSSVVRGQVGQVRRP